MNLQEFFQNSADRIEKLGIDVSNNLESLNKEIKNNLLPSSIDEVLFDKNTQVLGIKDYIGIAILVGVTALLIKFT